MTSDAPQDKPPAGTQAAQRLDRVIGFLIIGCAFAASLAASRWARDVSRQDTPDPPAPPDPAGVVGWPDLVDPVGTLPRARQLTRRPMLRGFIAEGVRNNGTLDMKGRSGQLRFSFQSPPTRLPQPSQQDAMVPLPPPCGMQSVSLKPEGLGADLDDPLMLCPVELLEPLPAPHCNLSQVWKIALDRGVPNDGLARIEYYRSRVGPAWRFEVPGTLHRFSLYGDCGRELTAEEAVGRVP